MNDSPARNRLSPRKRGGARFPRVALGPAVRYGGTLCSITQERPLPREVVYPAVFNARSWLGSVRASALKQYGLMEGNVRGYQASDLAREILTSSNEQRKVALLQRACLNPKIFGRISEAVNLSDGSGERDIPTSALSEEAARQKVHPDSVGECVKIYVASLEFAGLAERDGDSILLKASQTGYEEPAAEHLKLEEQRKAIAKQRDALLNAEDAAKVRALELRLKELEILEKELELDAKEIDNEMKVLQLLEKASSLAKDGVLSADKIRIDVNGLIYVGAHRRAVEPRVHIARIGGSRMGLHEENDGETSEMSRGQDA